MQAVIFIITVENIGEDYTAPKKGGTGLTLVDTLPRGAFPYQHEFSDGEDPGLNECRPSLENTSRGFKVFNRDRRSHVAQPLMILALRSADGDSRGGGRHLDQT